MNGAVHGVEVGAQRDVFPGQERAGQLLVRRRGVAEIQQIPVRPGKLVEEAGDETVADVSE